MALGGSPVTSASVVRIRRMLAWAEPQSPPAPAQPMVNSDPSSGVS